MAAVEDTDARVREAASEKAPALLPPPADALDKSTAPHLEAWHRPDIDGLRGFGALRTQHSFMAMPSSRISSSAVTTLGWPR